MGKLMCIYLNNYYYKIFEEIKKEFKKEGYEFNNTDIIRIALINLYKKLKNEKNNL